MLDNFYIHFLNQDLEKSTLERRISKSLIKYLGEIIYLEERTQQNSVIAHLSANIFYRIRKTTCQNSLQIVMRIILQTHCFPLTYCSIVNIVNYIE